PLRRQLGRRVAGGHHGDGGLQLAAAFDRPRRLRRLGRQGAPATHASAVERLSARGRRAGGGRDRRRRHDESRLYSPPGEGPRLAESHRREFLERTDRGVFSLQAEATLNRSRRFRTLAGRATAIEAGERQVVVTIEYWRGARAGRLRPGRRRDRLRRSLV